MVDKAKLVFAVALVALGVWGYYRLGDTTIVLRVLVVIAGLLAAAAVAWWSEPGKQFAVFAGESAAEVKKVVWPTRKETIQTTAAVFAFVVVMAVFLWLTDKGLEWVLYDLIMGWRKCATAQGRRVVSAGTWCTLIPASRSRCSARSKTASIAPG
jgi:preprotein translocase subunit SecE